MRNLFLFTVLVFIVSCSTPEKKSLSNIVERGHKPINGINMYYEVHGGGAKTPLVLLHGGGSTIDVTFSKVLPTFAQSRKVIAIEEQGHGRTSDRNKPFRFDTSADDVASLLKKLDIEKADIFGFSNGANVGLQVAIRHPELVRKLVFASSITKKSGAHPQIWEFMKKADISNMPPPLKEAFLKVNPSQEKLKVMHDKDAARMLSFKDVPDNDLKKIQAEVLILIGDRDIVKPSHALMLSQTVPRSRLMILPAGHGDYLGEIVMSKEGSRYPEKTAGLIEQFLNDSTLK